MKNLFKLILALSFTLLAQSVTFVTTIDGPAHISMDSRKTASQVLHAPEFSEYQVYTSEPQSPGHLFTTVGGVWEQTMPEGSYIAPEARFKVDEQWSNWLELEAEDDLVDPEKKFTTASSGPATTFQYRFTFYSNGTETPSVNNAQWTFIKTGTPLILKTPPRPEFAASNGSTKVVTRSQWGANESYRYLSDNNAEAILIQLSDSFYEDYADELGYDHIEEADADGNKYKWPIQYAEQVRKVVIHHTATTKKLDNPEQAIRDIYHFHAMTRGWGDIGYNYIMDTNGTVYEGRAGGEGVVAAHAGPGNHGSIGIAVLGTYQNEAVPQKVIESLGDLVYEKAKIHGIDPEGRSSFRGEIMDNIFGHRDIMATTCPGDYLYAQLPKIRQLASNPPQKVERYVKDYAYIDESELFYIEMEPEEERQVTIQIENIGKKDWDSNTYIVVDDNPEFNNIISFPTKEGDELARMDQAVVSPGNSATFKFTIKAGTNGDSVHMLITPVIDGSRKLFDGINLPVKVSHPSYEYELVSEDHPGKTMKKGTEHSGEIILKNKGNTTWRNIYLTSSDSEIFAELQESEVKPDGTGTFKYTYNATTLGQKYYVFYPDLGQSTEISGDMISFGTLVYDREYASEIFGKSILDEWQRSTNYNLSLKIRNTGAKTWKERDLEVSFLRNPDITIKDLNLSPETVAPGEVATISFTTRPKNDAALGNGVMLVTPKIDDNNVLRPPAVFKYKIVNVAAPVTAQDSDSKVRVKLGFEGEPEITANGAFNIYAGSNKFATLSGGDIANVEYRNGKYKITADGIVFLKDNRITFKPKNGAILQIDNFEHRPSWNESLNDNEYRGDLEVRWVNDELIVINELTLEGYMHGLAEALDTSPIEKVKALTIAARSYALYYMTIDDKFPGMPYHLDDNPNVTQKYLGYGFEKRAPNVAAAVDATAGKVITFGGTIVKPPYFSQSNGVATKSANEVWGWTTTPYLVSVDDSACTDGTGVFLGHGVGMSGCGARGLANQGWGYEDILKHFYTGIEIADLD